MALSSSLLTNGRTVPLFSQPRFPVLPSPLPPLPLSSHSRITQTYSVRLQLCPLPYCITSSERRVRLLLPRLAHFDLRLNNNNNNNNHHDLQPARLLKLRLKLLKALLYISLPSVSPPFLLLFVFFLPSPLEHDPQSANLSYPLHQHDPPSLPRLLPLPLKMTSKNQSPSRTRGKGKKRSNKVRRNFH